MEDKLISTLEVTGYPVYRQGSLSDSEDWDKSFYTFWNDETPVSAAYDNKECAYDHSFTLCCYSTDPALTYSMLLEAKTLLMSVGFEVYGKGYDVASGRTEYTGRGIDVLFKEVI